MKDKKITQIWIIMGITLIIGVLSTTIIMVVNGINIITQPLPTSISLAFVLPMAGLYLFGFYHLNKMKKKRLYEAE